jgi:hypothetical protein
MSPEAQLQKMKVIRWSVESHEGHLKHLKGQFKHLMAS